MTAEPAYKFSNCHPEAKRGICCYGIAANSRSLIRRGGLGMTISRSVSSAGILVVIN
jgi:hypothetical protein